MFNLCLNKSSFYVSHHCLYFKKGIEVEILLFNCNFVILKTSLSVILTNQSILVTWRDVTWRDMTYGQVWWPILWICALQLTHPKCTHTAVNTHTHTVWTHPEQWGSHLCCGARGAVGGSVPCSRAPQSWYWGWRERCTFTPPTYNSCRPKTH